MTKKRVQYIPVVASVSDLPAPTAFESGVLFYVRAERKFYVTDGSAWSILNP